MRFTETPLAGAWVIEVDLHEDERGAFARTFDRAEFRARGLNPAVAQCNFSRNRRRGTLRGMHYQAAPHAECKLVRCTRGALFDVIVDLRPGSRTLCEWFGVELSEDTARMLYVAEGLAHGFQTLQDDTTVQYQMSAPYVPGAARGVRWDDPAFGIKWPPAERIMSERDRGFPDYHPEDPGGPAQEVLDHAG
jgi:dTDP-4-dehydrorhamnose 3,5-epimerase